jgi:P4 family phage/plasmid primase-like protien
VLARDIMSLFANYKDMLAPMSPDDRENLFYTLGHHAGAYVSTTPQRSASTFESQSVIAFDIDGMSPDDLLKWRDYAKILADIIGATPESFNIICSGNGLHFIFHLAYQINQVSYFKNNKPYYNATCERIDLAIKEAELSGHADPVIFDPARVLRVPGTKNVKLGKPTTDCVMLQESVAQLQLDWKVASGIGDIAEKNVTPAQIRRNYPLPDFPKIYQECRFIQHCVAHPEEVHEPDAFALFSLLAPMPPASRVFVGMEEKNGQEIARYVFDNAESSASLKRTDFDKKWSDAGKYGARKCSTMAEEWPGCKECPHYGKIITPLALKSEDHIESEQQGFWCYNASGEITNPHYADLTRVFKKECSAVTLSGSRVYSFNGKFYNETPELVLKNWIQNKVKPSDPLRDRHRMEFVKSIHANTALTLNQEDDFLHQAPKGKLNLKNGVLDIRTGELIPHSPAMGFTYSLPHEYTPGLASEYFLDWLSDVMLHRAELIESVLDFMAYCLWPDYDDHVFAMLLGGGKNGKSTLLELIRTIVGKENTTAISLWQLTSTRFAAIELNNKLVNLCEETSGREMSYEQMNQLKILSSGGSLFVERKGEQGFSMTSTAKLMFSANTMPKIPEYEEAVKRRLLIIPFDKQFETPDERIGRKLRDEAPAILSMLIAHIQRKISEDGVYKVYRGGVDAQAEQKKALMSNSSVAAWYAERVEQKIGNYVTLDAAYADYRDWSTKAGLVNLANRLTFGKYLARFYYPPGEKEHERIKRISGLNTRVINNIALIGVK